MFLLSYIEFDSYPRDNEKPFELVCP